MRKMKEQSPEAIDELLGLLAKIDQIDLTKLEKELEEKKTKKQRAVEEMISGEFKLKPKKKAKKHWKAKRRYWREYHQTVRKPAQRKRRAVLLEEGGWYGILHELWTRAELDIEVTREEWEEAVGTLDDVYPMVTRYDRSVGIRLDNVLVRDRDTLQVVFDGKEHLLRKHGYIL